MHRDGHVRVPPNRIDSGVRSSQSHPSRAHEGRIRLGRGSRRTPRNFPRPGKSRPFQDETIVGGRVHLAPILALGFGFSSRNNACGYNLSTNRSHPMRAIDYFDKGAEANPDRVAILDGTRSYSYREVRALTEQIACAMRAHGLRDEDRAAVYSPNDARVLICMFGLMRAGAAWVPMNSRNATDASVEYMNYVETSWLF